MRIDVKFLERLPSTGKRLYQFTAIDDCTRVRILKVFDACNQRTAIQFINDVRKRLPFRILTVQTDNGAEFQTQFHGHLLDLDIRHVYIRPRSPHLNGKVERSHRVDDQEFYQLLDADGITDDIHLFNDKLREWEDYYNYHRPHGESRRIDEFLGPCIRGESLILDPGSRIRPAHPLHRTGFRIQDEGFAIKDSAGD